MKKIAIMLCSIMITMSFTACSLFMDDEESSMDNSVTPTPMIESSDDVTSEMPDDISPSPSTDPEMSGDTTGDMEESDLASYADTIKETYSDDYKPDKKLSEDEINEKLKISSDLYEDIHVEHSTEEGNPDIFVAVKAKEGKETEIETKLNEYKDSLKADTAYEKYADKIDSAEIFTNGSHVFMVLVGADEFEDGMDNMAENYKTEIKKGVDAIQSTFQ